MVDACCCEQHPDYFSVGRVKGNGRCRRGQLRALVVGRDYCPSSFTATSISASNADRLKPVMAVCLSYLH